METIPKKDCTKIGFIRKTHGVHGEVALEFESQFEYTVETIRRFFIELDGLLVPFFVSKNGVRIRSGKTALITFDWVDSENYARRFVGQDVYLFKNEIIEENKIENSPNYLNYKLEDKSLGIIGTILEVNDYSGNIVMTVLKKDRQVLIPFNEDFLISIDDNQKTLTMDLPEGLFSD